MLTSAAMSFFVQSQISTSKPSSSMRRTRSRKGRSVKTISADTASRKLISPDPRSAPGGPVRTDSAAARAISSAARASSPVTGAGPAGANGVDERGQLRGIGAGSSSWSLRAVSASSPAAPENTIPVRRPPPMVAIPPEPKTSPRTS